MNKDQSFFRLLTGLACFLCLVCLMPRGASAEDPPKKIMILPFEVYSKAQREAQQEALQRALVSELGRSRAVALVPATPAAQKSAAERRIDDGQAVAFGKEAGVDYVLAGSLTAFGEVLSLDVRVISVREEKSLPAVFVQGRPREDVGVLAGRLRNDLLMRLGVEHAIVRIEFQGNRKIESVAIGQVLKSSVGKLFSESVLSDDIKAVYKMGYFQDVKADVTAIPEGKVVTFIVQEKPLIMEILIKGNKAVDADDIRSAMSVKPRQIVNPERLAADVEKIKSLYEGKGYYNAEVRTAVEKEGEKDSRIVVTITENNKLYVERITFEGNRTFRDKELKKMMKTSEWDLLHFFTDSGLLKKEELKQDQGKLMVFYHNNGFINAQIGDPEVTHDRKGIYVKIPITEGRQFRVGKVDITGDTLKVSQKELMDQLEIKKTDHYDRSAIMKDIEALTKAANDEGYAYADVTPRTAIRDKEQVVDIAYHLTKGNLVYFNRISFTGNTKTRDKVMRRSIFITEGDLYNSTKLKNSYKNLERLRYFEEINFQTEKGPADNLTDVIVQVKEKPTGMISIGAGYSAWDGAALMAEISQQNLFGRGQVLKVKASLGQRAQWYELEFIEPALFDLPLWSRFALWNSAKSYDWYDVYSTGFGVTLSYPIWEYVSGSIGYTFSADDVKNMSLYAPVYYQTYVGSTTTSQVTVGLTRDTSDDNLFPTKGSRNSASVSYAGGPLGGSADFIKYGFVSSWFFPLPLDTVFAIRGRWGLVEGQQGHEVPLYERYTLGGLNSLRGLRSVGPTDPTGLYVVGGKTMMVFNTEYIFPLIKNAGIKGVVFYDTGNAWESGYHLNDMRQTAGAGIRWYSPIGPLRLEWGYVLDRKESEGASRWEFAIGMFM